jgi:glycosyltransferase involved in cell wall biosynthesis
MTLVSVVIPTYNRPVLLMERALPSVLAQTHSELDIHIVGDGTDDETCHAMAAVTDPRVRFTNLPHADYPSDPYLHWCAMGVPPINHGLDTALGEWVSVLADDDALPPDSIARMLAALDGADCVYGRTEVVGHGVYGAPGEWTDGAYLLRSSLGYRYDAESWKHGVIADYDLRARLWQEVRTRFLPEIVYRYWPANQVPPVEAFA